MFSRNTGKLCFVTLQQGDGTRLQAMLSAAQVGKDSLSDYKTDVDLGDHLFVYGRVIASKRGELSVMAQPGEDGQPAWQLTAKSLRPLPKTFKTEDGQEVSLSEDQRVRHRELDMITREAAREMVRTRAQGSCFFTCHFIRAGLYRGGNPDVADPARRGSCASFHHSHECL